MNTKEGSTSAGQATSQMHRFGLLAALLTAATHASAVLPPRYLAIPAFEKCLAEQQNGSFQTWCMPATKLRACPQESWRALRQLKGNEKLPLCESQRGKGR